MATGGAISLGGRTMFGAPGSSPHSLDSASCSPSTVEIPFTIAGDFVYHCHILEHEDGGMMARIRVRPRV
jgi:FtsP/CotA-like multicopper oxidase with cupredoxin domain